MKTKILISVIIPIFNAKKYIKNFFESFNNQTFKKKFEIIIINDASKDNSLEILNNLRLDNLRIYSLKKNSGQSIARNYGITKAVGEYLYFADIDDGIHKRSLEILYNTAKKFKCDYVFSDFQKIKKFTNLRKNKFTYKSNNLYFRNKDIKKEMINALHNPNIGHLGLIGCNGRLIKSSLIKKNKIFFQEKLRFCEDKVFSWSVLSHLNKVIYIKKQLYKYNININSTSGVVNGLIKNLNFESIKIIMDNLKQALKQKKFLKISKLYHQGIIFHFILFLVSLSRSIKYKKIKKNIGIKIRRNFIKKLINNKIIIKSIQHYNISEKESKEIPKYIKMRSVKKLELACDKRANQVASNKT